MHIKIHQIHKAKAMEILFRKMGGVVHTVGIALIINMLGSTPAGKDIVDLAHANGRKALGLDGIQQGLRGRL